jgi:branched-chain amino acid transport system substrate-binding protein
MRTFALATAVLSFGLAQAQTLTTIKLPLVLPLSSSLGAFALEVENAATLAINTYAPRFAKQGFKLEMVVYDDKGNPDTVKGIADILKKDQSIRAIMGGITSGVAINLSAALQDSHIAMVSSGASASDVTEKGFTNFNRVVARNAAQAEGTVDFVTQTLNAKTLFVIDDASVNGKDGSDNITRAATKGGIKVFDPISTPERENFSEISKKVQKASPDVIQMYFTSTAGAVNLIKQLQADGIKSQIVGSPTFLGGQFIDSLGKASEGLYASTNVAPAAAYPNAKSLLEQYKATYGQEASVATIMGYDATVVVLEGILNSVRTPGKLPARRTVETAIRKTKLVNQASGNIQFNSVGDRRDASVYILKIGSDLKPRVFNTYITTR